MYRSFTIILALLVCSCNPSVRPIDYTLDACEYCRMTITDARFAAEIVTDKGKVYTFDAIECMVNSLDDFSDEELAQIVVMDYNKPDQWINAAEGVFVIEPNILSPMGANLACFSSESEAISTMQISQDLLISWEELRVKKFSIDH